MISYAQISSLYVAPQRGGRDDNSGLSAAVRGADGPLATVGEALRRVASLRRIGARQPISIRLEPGTYTFSAPLVLDETVSGVTLMPDGVGEVIFSGGVPVRDWQQDTFNGTPCLSAEIPAVRDSGFRFTDLYVNGKRACMTRYPAEGYLYPESVEVEDWHLTSGSRWFIAEEGDLRDFRNFEDCIISYYHHWIDEHSPIESYDPETRRVTMRYRSRFTVVGGRNTNSGLAYILENVAEMFLHPDEWYLDRPAGKVYYIPRDDSITPETIDAWAPVAEELLRVEGGAENICIRGITFAYTRGDYASRGFTSVDPEAEPCAADAQSVCNAGGVITFQNASHCTLSWCRIRNIGHYGILIGEKTNGIRVEDTEIYDGGMGGVRLNGSRAGGDPALACRAHTVTRCRMTKLGQRYLAGCGVLLMNASECEISHSEIADLYYTGISVGWEWGYGSSSAHHNRILCNHIHDLGRGKLSDMGGVYLLGRQSGTVVAGNWIHDVISAYYGGWGLYADEGSSELTMENNLCYRVSQNCFHQHYGAMNTVRNNIFAHAGEAAMLVSRSETHLSVILEHNIVLTGGKPALALTRAQTAQGSVAVHDNYYIGEGEAHIRRDDFHMTLEEATACGFETGSVRIDDPFVNAAENDFTLRFVPDGFVPFSLPHTGPGSR